MKTILTSVTGGLLVLLLPFFAAAAASNTAVSGEIKTMSATKTATERAIFAGGCFWCMEKPFEKLDGVLTVISGYSGGTTENPTYENYHDGGHIEVVEIVYDPARVSYKTLLKLFWKQINPTDPGGQFADRGHGYTTAIFYTTEERLNRPNPSTPQRTTTRIITKKIPCATVSTVPAPAAMLTSTRYGVKSARMLGCVKSGRN
jgi:peptide methionine sulfoxide reductase msrA/msrB